MKKRKDGTKSETPSEAKVVTTGPTTRSTETGIAAQKAREAALKAAEEERGKDPSEGLENIQRPLRRERD